MQEIWMELAKEGVMALAGLVLTGLGLFGSFYISKLMSRIKEKELLDTVARYVRWAEQAPAFKEWTGGEKFEIVFSKAIQWAHDNRIPINEDELAIMVEEAVQRMKAAMEPLIGVLE